jgi:hypothetical protein
MTTTTDDLAPGADGELAITELVEFDPTRLDGVKAGATGIGFLVMKSAAAAEPAEPAEPDARALATAAIAKAVTDGKVDEGPDVSLGQQIMRLIAQAIQAEAAEIEAGAYDEVMDVRLLCRAADMMASWTGREQGGCGCCAMCTGPGCGCCMSCQPSMDGMVMDAAKALDELLGDDPWDYQGDDVAKDSRTFSAAERKKHAKEGNALPDGSYPIPDADALRRAAILARSKHGNWKAARRLIARRAKELGVANPLDEDDTDASSSKGTLADKEATVQTDPDDGQIATAVDAAVAKALAPLKERNDTLGAELAKAQADIAKFLALPRPGGPVMSVTRAPQAPGAEDHAAKAAYYDRMADSVASAQDADGYRQLAAQARARITHPA